LKLLDTGFGILYMSLSQVDPIVSSFLTGRVGRRPPGARLQVSIDDIAQPPVRVGLAREFSVPLPAFLFDGAAHQVDVSFSGTGIPFENSPLHFQSNYQGYVHMEPFAGALLTGWAIDLARPQTVQEVEILLHGRPIATTRADIFRADLLAALVSSGNCAFCCSITHQEQLDQSAVLRARILGTHFDLRGSPVLYLDTSRFLKTLHRVNSAFHFLKERTAGSPLPSGPGIHISDEERRTFADLLLSSGNLAELMELSRWFQAASQQHISATGHRHRFFTYLTENFAGSATIRDPTLVSPIIDVIFYVHPDADPARVLHAFDLLLASPENPAFSVICVLHTPPESCFERDTFLRRARGRDVTVLDHSSIQDFSASINQAASRHGDRDIVIFDCETVVAGNWLARLREASGRSPASGIVTPFATSGEICNYSPPPSLPLSPADLDAICTSANRGQTIDLPSTHGLCSLISRACLDEVGLFDVGVFSTRIHAMADFCLRAGTRGWRTILAADVLVHSPIVGGDLQKIEDDSQFVTDDLQIVADDSQILADDSEKATSTLDVMHPYYGDLLVNFNLDNPARPLRRSIELAILRSQNRPVYCFLTHGFGGGTERHVRDLCSSLSDQGAECIVIFALDRDRASCVVPRLPFISSMVYQLELDYESMVRDLATLDIRHFHVHSNIAIPQQLMRLPAHLNVPYDCTVHDYSWFCPRVNLIDDSGLYCGEPSPAVCNACIRKADPGIWKEFNKTHHSVEELREKSYRILAGARKVFCPSRDTQLRMARQLGLTNLEVRPNLEPTATSNVLLIVPSGPQPTIVVGIIGYLSQKKGMGILRDCAKAALKDSLPLRFVVVGFTEDDSSFAGLSNVTITGRYQEGQAGTIIASHKIRLALFPSVCPETYSYTLSIAIGCGLYPVAFDLGAIAERIRQLNFGHLLPLETRPEDLNVALLACGLMSYREPPQLSFPDTAGVFDYYYGSVDSEKNVESPTAAVELIRLA
jgi:glycosyltransferase involved in cell wall biosynthesis